MGGNVKIGDHVAQPIKITPEFIEDIRSDIISVMYSIGYRIRQDKLFSCYGAGGILNLDCFTGSITHLMSGRIPEKELLKYKPTFGDVDIQVDRSCEYILKDLFQPGFQAGPYEYRGRSNHGNETSVLMQHRVTGEIHQFDFQYVDQPGSEPQRFLHSSEWTDIRLGVKGAHHKLLLNAIGLDWWKFSIVNGLSTREPHLSPMAIQDPVIIYQRLFSWPDIGKSAPLHQAEKIKSFRGLCDLITQFFPAERQQRIYDKFAHDVAERVKDDAKANRIAKDYLREGLITCLV